MAPASEADYPAFARLFAELHVPEPVPELTRYALAILPDLTFVREDERVAGYVWARARGSSWHVVHVVVDAAFRGRGVGHLLMEAAAAQGRAAGHSQWMLNVKPDNHAARALYTSCGMRDVMHSVSMHASWAQLAEIAGASAQTGPLLPADDARFETALGLSPGEIQSARAIPGRSVFGATDPTGPVGIAALDPSFPGISPLRVRDVAFARALFAAARPDAARDGDRLHVFVEGLPALEAALAGVGAVASMRVIRMEGPLPAAGPLRGSRG